MTAVTSDRFTFSASHEGTPIEAATADGWELTAAKRALALIKAELGSEGMLKLLEQHRKRAVEYFTKLHEASDGRYCAAVVDITVTGLSTLDFLAWFRAHGADQPSMLAGHPEHYVLTGDTDEQGNLRTHRVCETMGGHPVFVAVEFIDPAEIRAEVPAEIRDPEAIAVLAGRGRLENGVEFARAFHQLKDTAEGFSARMCSMFPAAMPDSGVQAHVEHQTIEFRNWMRMAAQAKSAHARSS